MRRPPSPWQFLTGLALLFLAYLLIVGSGMDLDVEHDQEHRWIVMIAVIMALGGVFLLWFSLRWPPKDRRR